MERTICEWCSSTAGTVVRGITSGFRRIKEFVQKSYGKQPSELPKTEVEEKEEKTIKQEKAKKTTFKYHDPDAKEVKLTGDFTNWKQRPLNKKGAGDWRITVELLPGKYYYKFVVDDKWTKDPNNPKSEPDPYGGERSIIEVKKPKRKQEIKRLTQ